MVPGTGIEPVRPFSKAADFKSAASTYSAIRASWANDRLRFTTCGRIWRRERESNSPKRICNPLHNRFAIAPRPQLTGKVSRLSDKEKGKPSFPFFQTGAGNESRTRDLNLGKVALYQLSYSRTILNYTPSSIQ